MTNLQRIRFTCRKLPLRGTIGIFACAVLVSACTTVPFEKKSEKSSNAPTVPRVIEAKTEATVAAPNCLLPGKVKRLATHFTYLEARRPVTISAEDCSKRGGEILSSKF